MQQFFDQNPLLLTILRRGSELFFVVLIAILLAQLVLAIITPLQVAPSAKPKNQVNAYPVIDIATLRNPNIFPSQSSTALVAATQNIQETSLDMKLHGVWVDGTSGTATLSLNSKQATYKIGAQITNGVTLARVFPDHVVINRQGNLESLYFANRKNIKFTSSLRENNTTISANAANAINLDRLSEIILLEPIHQSGLFKIKPGTDKIAFAATGLEEGDILRQINGQTPPSRSEAILELIQEIQQDANTASLNLIVSRHGQDQNVSLVLQ